MQIVALITRLWETFGRDRATISMSNAAGWQKHYVFHLVYVEYGWLATTKFLPSFPFKIQLTGYNKTFSTISM